MSLDSAGRQDIAAPVGWGLVGLGRHAERYLAPAIASAYGSRLVAVASSNQGRADEIANRYPGTRAYTSVEALAADEQVSAVFIASANDRHVADVLAAAAAGCHVLCEKPLAPSPQECVALITSCEAEAVTLGLGLNLRHNPAIQQAREALTGGTIGRVLYCEIQYIHILGADDPVGPRPEWRLQRSLGGGRFVGTGIHAFDLARYLLAGEIEEMSVQPGNREARQDVNVTLAVARMKSGEAVSVAIGRAPFAENRVSVYGTDGLLRLDTAIGNFGGGVVSVEGKRPGRSQWDRSDPYQLEVEEFCSAVREHRTPLGDPLSGVRLAAVLDAAEESADTAQRVRVEYAEYTSRTHA